VENRPRSKGRDTMNKVDRDRSRRRLAVDRLMYFLCFLCVLIAVVPLLSVLYYVAASSLAIINFSFLTGLPRPPDEYGGIGNAMQGTFIVVATASLIGLPIGVFAGIYLAEYGNNRIGGSIRFVADILAGVPSIVVGLFAYSFIVLAMKRFSALAGGVALAAIMIPIVARTTEESVKLVPNTLREAALALGITKWRTALYVAVSTARSGILTGIMLSIARISGETAPLLFTAFGNRYWAVGIDQPVETLPVRIFNYAIAPYDRWHAEALGAAFLLIILMLAINLLVRFAVRGRYSPTR